MSWTVAIAGLLFTAACTANDQPARATKADSAAPSEAPRSTAASATVSTPATAEAPQSPARPSFDEQMADAARKPVSPVEGDDWHAMFDGESLAGWKETKFAGRAEVEVKSGLLICNMGDPFTGVNYTNAFPEMNYEITLEAMRVMGSDFFCGLTVPVETNNCSLVVGGWGGGLVGISSVDGMDASENETTKFYTFDPKQWYRIRLRVTEDWIEAWIGSNKVVNLQITDRRLTVRPGDIELSKPMGIACWQTAAAYRDIKYRQVTGPADQPRKRRPAQ